MKWDIFLFLLILASFPTVVVWLAYLDMRRKK